MERRLRPLMRKGFIFALLLAIVAMPMAFGGVGFCRSMPCCRSQFTAHVASIHQPDCCNTTNCDQAPAAAGEYTSAKHNQAQTPCATLIPVAVLPTLFTSGQPSTTSAPSPPPPPPALQRRMAVLSALLI